MLLNFQLEEIVGRQGLVVVTRMNSNPSEFVYNSDLLTKYMVSQFWKMVVELLFFKFL